MGAYCMNASASAVAVAPVKKIKLGLWGLPNAGKTVYMTMLYHYLNLSNQWRVLLDENTLDFVDYNKELLIEQGKFIPKTDCSANKTVYTYKLINNYNRSITELNFIDLSGELLLEKDLEVNRQNIYDYFNSCHGIIFFVSPLQTDPPLTTGQSYIKLLGNLLNKMQIRSANTERLEQYVAFCITKVDHADFYETHQQSTPEDALLKLLGPNINLNWFNNYFHIKIDERKKRISDIPNKNNRCKFFYISPFGVYKDKNGVIKSPIEEIEPSTEQPEKLAAKVAKTYRFNANPPELKSSNVLYLNDKKPSEPTNPLKIVAQANSSVLINYADLAPKADETQEINTLYSYEENRYKINTQVAFNPINMLSPIEWILNGINEYFPNINDLQNT